jgi:hypothetical protein
MGIHSMAFATSPDGVHWSDLGARMVPFDEGTTCPSTGSGSGSVWIAASGAATTSSATTANSSSSGRGDIGSSSSMKDAAVRAKGASTRGKNETFVINYSHGSTVRFLTGPTPSGPWTPVGPTTPESAGFGPGHQPPTAADGAQWYHERWDTINAWPLPDNSNVSCNGTAAVMWGWCTATAIVNPAAAWGSMCSTDGLNWVAQPPARIASFGK